MNSANQLSLTFVKSKISDGSPREMIDTTTVEEVKLDQQV